MLGALAECSFDMAIASNPWMIAQASTIMLRMPVIGTCPLSAPASFSANSAGSSLRVTRIAGSPACAIVASIGAALPSENSTSGSPACFRHSIVTMESLPPPTGTQVSRGSSSRTARRRLDCLRPTMRSRDARSMPLRQANSPRPFT